MENKWQFYNKLNNDTINDIEMKFNISFPNDIKEFLLKYNASSPSSKFFDTVETREEMLNNIIDFNKGSIDSFEEIYITLKDFLPLNTIPFARDGMGNYICTQENEDNGYKIVFFEHETQTLMGITDSLSEFISSLYKG